MAEPQAVNSEPAPKEEGSAPQSPPEPAAPTPETIPPPIQPPAEPPSPSAPPTREQTAEPPPMPPPEPLPSTLETQEPAAAPAAASHPAPHSEHPDLRAILREAKARKREHRLEKLLDLARRQGAVANRDIQRILRVSDATATRYAQELISRGLLQKSGRTRSAVYRPL